MRRDSYAAWPLSLALLLSATPTFADVTATGDVPPLGDGFTTPGDVDLGNSWLSVGSTAAGSLDVDSGSDLAAKTLRVGFQGTGDGTLMVDGGSVDLQTFLFVGREGAGVATLSNGASLDAERGRVAWGSTSTGALNLEGVGTFARFTENLFLGGTPENDGGAASLMMDENARLYVGDLDSATLDPLFMPEDGLLIVSSTDPAGSQLLVRNGAKLNAGLSATPTPYIEAGFNAGEKGEIAVIGAGSEIAADTVLIGGGGTGVLRVESGGKLTAASDLIFAALPGSTGSLTVAGAGSQVLARLVNLGADAELPSGVAQGTVAEGGQLIVGDASTGALQWLADQGGGLIVNNSASLFIADATVDPRGGFLVGNGSTLTTSGLAVIAYDSVGDNGAAADRATVEQQGSSWTHAGKVIVGEQGDGGLTVGTGASVVASSIDLAAQPGASADVVVDGQLRAAESMTIGGSSTDTFPFDVEGGQVKLRLPSTGQLIVGDHPTAAVPSGGLVVGRDVAQAPALLRLTSGVSGDELELPESSQTIWSQEMVVHNQGNTIVGADSNHSGRIEIGGTTQPRLVTRGASIIGHGGEGHVTVRDGTLDDRFATVVTLGEEAGSTGLLELIGANAEWETSGAMFLPPEVELFEIIIGDRGKGVHTVADGATSTHDFAVSVGAGVGGEGEVIVRGEGSAFDVFAELALGGDFFGPGGVGRLEVQRGGVATAGELILWQGGSARITGGRLSVDGVRLNGGTIDFQQGILEIDQSSLDPDFFYPNGFDQPLAQSILGDGSTVSRGQELRLGSVDLNTAVTVDGGKLVIDDPAGLGLVDFKQGTVRVGGFADVVIGQNTGGRRLTVSQGQRYEIEDGAEVAADGVLDLQGGVVSSVFVTNNGIIEGSGSIESTVTTTQSGAIDLREGDRIEIQRLVNDGRVTIRGGELDVFQSINNNGVITAEDATIRARPNPIYSPDGSLFLNYGSIAFNSGINRVHGAIFNGASTGALGLINITAGAQVTFFDIFINQELGGVNVFEGGSAVFYGYSGDAPAGTGDIQLLGDLSPGFSPGAFTFGGDVTFGAGSSTEIELAGLTPEAEHDIVAIGGQLALGGTLAVVLIEDPAGELFTPSLGDVFEIVSAGGGLTGNYSVIDLPDLGLILDWEVLRDENAIALAVIPALTGDYNADGVVDVADVTVWRDSLGDAGPGLAADGDRDGEVTTADYALWKANFGAAIDFRAAGSVPEPASLLVLLPAAASLAGRRRFADIKRFGKS